MTVRVVDRLQANDIDIGDYEEAHRSAGTSDLVIKILQAVARARPGQPIRLGRRHERSSVEKERLARDTGVGLVRAHEREDPSLGRHEQPNPWGSSLRLAAEPVTASVWNMSDLRIR